MSAIKINISAECLTKIRQDIRAGRCIETQQVIEDWLCIENFHQHSVTQQLSSLKLQFQLLLDVICDELISLNWRRLCYQSIYKPLFMLKELQEQVINDPTYSDSEQFNQQVDALFNELKLCFEYFGHQLRSPSCNYGNH